MKRLIDQFVEKVLNTTESFMLEAKRYNDTVYHFFMQCNVGKAKYVYGKYTYGDKNFYINLEERFYLVAIVSDGKVYVVNRYSLEILDNEKVFQLPEDIFLIQDIVEKENKYVESVVFTEFYKTLGEKPITDRDLLQRCVNETRRILFAKESIESVPVITPMFNEQDIADSLCGILDLKTEAMKRLEDKKEEWVYKKSFNSKVRELMKNYSVVEDYQIKIAKGLNSVDAKTVVIEFELNGKKASEKIKPNIIIGKMINDDYFCDYDFQTRKAGEILISKLGAATSKWCSDNEREVITCKHITKITYGKKVLYERE